MAYSDEANESFYQDLAKIVDDVSEADKLLILGDFNARVGKDHSTYEGVIGKFGKGNKNSNGDLMLNFCTQRGLCITNTFFLQPEKNFFTWMHPRSKHFHLLDYIVTRRADFSDVLSTKAMRGAECSTDHYMVRSQIRLQIVLPRRKTPSGTPKKLDVIKLKDEPHRRRLEAAMTTSLQDSKDSSDPSDVEEQWKQLKETILSTAKDVLGHPKRKSPDWFQEHESSIQELLDEKRKLHMQHLKVNSVRSKTALKNIKAKVQREIRAMKDKWWNDKAAELQAMADKNDTHGLFSGLKAIYGPRSNTVAPVKTADGSKLCTDKKDITERWREHFSTLLNQQGAANDNASQQLTARPVREELCSEFTMEELEKALSDTSSGKSPGQDGIPADVLKHGGTTLKRELLNLFSDCWQNECLPQDFKDVLIVTIYKKKGDRSDCGNHRGISLLSIAGKIMAKILLNHLKTISEDVLPESQCGFRGGRATTDMIFTLRQLQEKAVEQQQPLYIVFVDFSKAFDTVDRKTLWEVLKAYGCPDKLVKMIKLFHEDMSGKVTIGGDVSEAFTVNHGVKQGCVLAPTLFTLYLAAVLETMAQDLDKGVYIRTRSDGKLFNLSRLKASTKVREICVRELLFADDSALVATDAEDMQEIVDRFSSAATLFGLRINVSKTELLYQPPSLCDSDVDHPPVIHYSSMAQL